MNSQYLKCKTFNIETMQNNLSKNNKTIFEQIKRLKEDGNEWWSARELGKILEYSEYRHFKPVIEKAKEACRNSGQEIANHFEDFLEMVRIGFGAERPMEDGVKLSRHACYLIVQNSVIRIFRITESDDKEHQTQVYNLETRFENFDQICNATFNSLEFERIKHDEFDTVKYTNNER